MVSSDYTAVVLGRYLTGGLGTVRCLGRKGIPVIWIDHTKKNSGFHSKYATGMVSPNPASEEEKYVEFLCELGRTLDRKGVFFPVGDMEVGVILRNRKKLEKWFLFPVTNWNTVKSFLDKRLFYDLLDTIGIAHAKTFFVSCVEELIEHENDFVFPCIVKPTNSVPFVEEFGVKVFITHCFEELLSCFLYSTEQGHTVVIQEVIEGDASTLYDLNAFVNEQQEFMGCCMYQRIREWPLGFGTGCLIEDVWVDELLTIAKKLVDAVGFFGIMDMEFKWDEKSNCFKVIELNPRCWMQVGFAERRGCNIPLLAYCSITGQENNKENKVCTGGRYLFFLDDLNSASSLHRLGNLSLKEWLHSYRGVCEYALFAWDDPLPFLILYLRILASKILRTPPPIK